jgi:hypothetical protein
MLKSATRQWRQRGALVVQTLAMIGTGGGVQMLLKIAA